MPRLTAALIREQGVTFVVALMKNHVLDNPSLADDQIRALALHFGCPLVVLMGESNHRLRGNRQDVVDFVANLHPSRIPWKQFDMVA